MMTLNTMKVYFSFYSSFPFTNLKEKDNIVLLTLVSFCVDWLTTPGNLWSHIRQHYPSERTQVQPCKMLKHFTSRCVEATLRVSGESQAAAALTTHKHYYLPVYT